MNSDRDLFKRVLHQLERTIAYSNEEMAALDRLKQEVRDRLAIMPDKERYFCQRCGKRLRDGIHTCTPPEDTLLQEINLYDIERKA